MVSRAELHAGSVHAVFRMSSGEHVCDLPWVDDDNHGLPDWFFGYHAATDSWHDSDYTSILVHPSGSAEWVPGMGPAPIWHSASAGLLPRTEMFRQNESWVRAVYCLSGEPQPEPMYTHHPDENGWFKETYERGG